jgi:NAD-dependent dihydropyrimidine dehydrogenase PreA subunit
MTYVINDACVDTLDASCVEVCPVDCIYQGLRSRYIHPTECIDCGACEPACPVSAIFYAPDAAGDDSIYVEDNARFFDTVLVGRDTPVGDPGGASECGVIGVDTPLVTSRPLASS